MWGLILGIGGGAAILGIVVYHTAKGTMGIAERVGLVFMAIGAITAGLGVDALSIVWWTGSVLTIVGAGVVVYTHRRPAAQQGD